MKRLSFPSWPHFRLHGISRTGGLLAASLCAVFAVSCQSANPPPGPQVRPAPVSRQWVKVSSQPPTFYPRGVSRDCPTDYQSGEWVETGDAAGSRYFIPLHTPAGPPRRDLVNEALAMRSERKMHEIANQDVADGRDQLVRFAKYSPILVPLNTVVIAGGLLGGGGIAPVGVSDFERWKAQWQKEYGDR